MGSEYQISVDLKRYPAAKHTRQGNRLTLDDGHKFEIASNRRD